MTTKWRRKAKRTRHVVLATATAGAAATGATQWPIYIVYASSEDK